MSPERHFLCRVLACFLRFSSEGLGGDKLVMTTSFQLPDRSHCQAERTVVMSRYLTDVQAGLALSASWGHPEMLQLYSRWDLLRQAK